MGVILEVLIKKNMIFLDKERVLGGVCLFLRNTEYKFC